MIVFRASVHVMFVVHLGLSNNSHYVSPPDTYGLLFAA